MLTILLICAAVLLGAAALYIGTRPPTFKIERSGQIDAPAAKVFSLIDDFHEWAKWSPWEKLDPEMKKTFSGATAGPGAVYAWAGNSKAGEGQMTVLSSTPGEQVTIELKFIKPFANTNLAKFQLTRNEAGTRVVWSMEGKSNLMTKAMSFFMDGMIGKDFERGLENLNTAAKVS